MLGELSHGTNLNENSDCQCFGQLLWPSSGQIVKKLVQILSILGMHEKSQSVKNVTGCHALGLGRDPPHFAVVPPHTFRVVNQKPGTSRPMSRLRSSSVAVWMWRAFFSWSSLDLLAQSITLVGWWCVQACLPRLTSLAFLCSESLGVPSSLLQASWLSCQCRSSHSYRGSGIQPWTVSLLEVCP